MCCTQPTTFTYSYATRQKNLPNRHLAVLQTKYRERSFATGGGQVHSTRKVLPDGLQANFKLVFGTPCHLLSHTTAHLAVLHYTWAPSIELSPCHTACRVIVGQPPLRAAHRTALTMVVYLYINHTVCWPYTLPPWPHTPCHLPTGHCPRSTPVPVPLTATYRNAHK